MSFSTLGLPEQITLAATASGYENATAIQSQAIPVLLEGRDLVACSQTGSGKTAAFAMPLLARVDLEVRAPQVLVLAPTRELATQVADSFREYGSQMPGLKVLPIFGGAAYAPQLDALRRGVHVVVGTPGRVLDHLRQGSLDLSATRSLVLDEADEMLQMGFIDDVRTVLEHAPEGRQIALFSATMPEPIREIAREHLRDPVELKADSGKRSASTIVQQYVIAPLPQKFEILARVLEAAAADATIIFVKTKAGTVELAERLAARGFRAAPLNGDIAQTLRQRTVDQLKAGDVDVLVATDVAARGLDVDRVSHVINYDLPRESEAYVHRIGRTGRAGRAGCAISLVVPAACRAIAHIARSIGSPIEEIAPPSAEAINSLRAEKFKNELMTALSHPKLDAVAAVLERIREETGESAERIAAAATMLATSHRPLLVAPIVVEPSRGLRPRGEKFPQRGRGEDRPPMQRKSFEANRNGEQVNGWRSYRVEVGRRDGVLPRNLVGAIANESGLDGRDIGRIEINEQFSIVDLPTWVPPAVFDVLHSTQIAGRKLRISEAERAAASAERPAFAGKKPYGPRRDEPGDRPFKKKWKKDRVGA